MDILLISTNRCQEPVPVIPLGACMVAEATERAGHRVELLDLMFEKDPLVSVRKAIDDFHPDVVALSIRNIDNTTMEKPESYVADLPLLVETIRHTGNYPIIIGGAAVGVAPDALLRLTGADWAICGAGEEALPCLLEALAGNDAAEDIPGVLSLKSGTLQGKRREGASPHAFLFPDPGRWLDLKPYRRQGGTVTIQTKRGCGFECIYCPCPQIEGSSYHLAQPEVVAAEVRRLAATGVRDVEFVDTVFNAPYEHALAICTEIGRDRPPVRLHTFELNPAFVDPPLLRAMARAGFAAVGLTAESASDVVLAGLGKNYRRDHLDRAAEALRGSSIPCLWIFMLGGPGETAETAAETIRFARERLRPQDVAFFSVGVRIYQGTGLEGVALAEGSLSEKEDLLAPVFYSPPGVSARELRRMVREAVATDPRFLTFGMESLKFLPPLRGLAGMIGVAPPLWRRTALIRRGLSLIGVRENIL